MSQLLISLFAFLIAISILIAVHEFGHFWVARRCGIKVLRFSIGFGRPLYRCYDKLGTEYVISAIPLGGYVSLFGEQNQTIAPAERHLAFCHKPVYARMMVLAAGPFFNFFFAIAAYWVLFIMGVTIFIPILGNVPKHTVAGLAGLRAGQEIVSIEEVKTPSWQAVSMQLLAHMGEDNSVSMVVKDKDGHLSKKILEISDWKDGASGTELENLGIVPVDPVPPVIGKVTPDLPAFKAGLKEGDRITSINNDSVMGRSEVIQWIQSHPNKTLHLEVSREGKKVKLTLLPMIKETDDGKIKGFIGAEFIPLKEMPKELIGNERFNMIDAFVQSCKKTIEQIDLTLKVLKKMIIGKVSVRHVSGPLAIAKYAGETVRIGLKEFLNFLGAISVSLGVLNLLPIPMLDGGHFMYCIYEVFTGRKVSETAQAIGFWIGGAILVGFMMLAFYNDLTHLLR